MGNSQKLPDSVQIDIGKRLGAFRETMALTQKEMAVQLEISTTHYGQVERGQKCISIKKLILLHACFGADITYILTGEYSKQDELLNILNEFPQNKIAVVKDALLSLLEMAK